MRLIWAAGLASLASSVALMLWYWPGAIPLDISSGVWTALAKDFADGSLYRPVFDGGSYGGTRYMPLFFVLHGALIHWGIDPVMSGLILTILSVVVFDLALFFALRSVGVRPLLAAPLALLGHATIAFQLLTVNVKADLLAAALNLSTLTVAIPYTRRPSPSSFGALILVPVLAVLTRLPSISGLLAAWLLIRGRFGMWRAMGYAAAVAGVLGAAGVVLYFASQGRILASFLSVASGGGGIAFALRFVLWFTLVVAQDPFSLLILAVALWYSVRSVGDRAGELPHWYFWTALVVTIPLFVSRGIDNNHLLDLLAASILVIGHELERVPRKWSPALLVPVALGTLNAAMWIPGVFSLRRAIEGEGRPSRQEIAAIAAMEGSRHAAMLSENPIVPILAGERPVVADPFSLRIVAGDRSDVRNAFTRQLRTGAFDAVVLVDWSGVSRDSVAGELRSRTDLGAVRFYGSVHFPPETLDLLARYYAVTAVRHPFVILTPRGGPVGSFAHALPSRSASRRTP